MADETCALLERVFIPLTAFRARDPHVCVEQTNVDARPSLSAIVSTCTHRSIVYCVFSSCPG